MKKLNLAVILSAVMLSVAGLAQAESSMTNHKDNMNRLNHHFSSKRPYQAPVENNNATKLDEQWEGATLVPTEETSVESKNMRNLRQLRINSTARRSYMG